MMTGTNHGHDGCRNRPDVLLVGPAGKETGGIARFIDQQRQSLHNDVSVSVFDNSTPDAAGPASFARATVAALCRLVAFPFRSRPDVVHVHTSHTYSFYLSAFYVLFTAFVWRRPVVLHVHGSSFDDFVETASLPVYGVQRLVFGASDRIVVLSEYWQATLEGTASADKLTVVPNAIHRDNYEPNATVETPTIVFVANHIERKGVEEFAEAIRNLNERTSLDFRVDIAGKGPLSERSDRLADRYPNVAYHGYVSEATKRSLISNGTIYVLPTFAEGLPIGLLEGMAGGNAVVSTNVGSIPEVIDDENGVVVPPGDVERLTAALERLVSDPRTVERMAESNRELVSRRYNWDAVSREILDVYRELCEDVEDIERDGADATAAGPNARNVEQ